MLLCACEVTWKPRSVLDVSQALSYAGQTSLHLARLLSEAVILQKLSPNPLGIMQICIPLCTYCENKAS